MLEMVTLALKCLAGGFIAALGVIFGAVCVILVTQWYESIRDQIRERDW